MADCLATNRETGLGDPDGLSTNSSLNSTDGVVEKGLVLGDVIRHGRLEVGIGVDANKVTSIDHSLVRRVYPSGPGVDVADRSRRERSARDGVTNLLDVGSDLERCSTGVLAVLDAGGGDAVEVLAANRDSGDETGKVGAICRDGRLESCNLVVEDGAAGRGPETEQ